MGTTRGFASAIADRITQFLEHKQVLGRRYQTEADALRLFDRYLIEHDVRRIGAITITPDLIDAFVTSRPRTRPRSFNHLVGVLHRLFDWLVVRDVVAVSPVRTATRRGGHPRTPFIFSPEQARRLMDLAARLPDVPGTELRGPTFRAVFATLYGLGLRVSEACRLDVGDVGRRRSLLVIRDTKFDKDRLVPFGLLADMYLDDLRDKTLRGLEGRALGGYATGGVPFGYLTVDEKHGECVKHRIEVNPDTAPIIRRIFEEYRNGGALHRIARALNIEGVPSPRAGSRHKRFGWGASTIRAMLYNEKYAGTWRFKERQWVKVPGTNKRRSRARSADEIITVERPELRIVDAETWAEVQGRLRAVHRKYTKAATEGERVATPRRCVYLLSGLLICDECGAPMTIYGRDARRYYRCSTHHTKGTCPNDLKVREESVRAVVLDAIREQVQSPKRIAEVRKTIAERLRDHSKGIDAELKDHRDRLKRTEERIKGLVSFIADGDRSEYVVSTLRDLEVQAKAERAAIERLHKDAQEPLRLPSLDERSPRRCFDSTPCSLEIPGRRGAGCGAGYGTTRSASPAGRAAASRCEVVSPLSR